MTASTPGSQRMCAVVVDNAAPGKLALREVPMPQPRPAQAQAQVRVATISL